MLSTVELVGVITGALITAQAVAWVLQRTLAIPVPSAQARIMRPAAGMWGETTRAHFHYVRRRTRYRVACPVIYQTSDSSGQGQGMVTDMSRDGWGIQSETSLPAGTVISMKICLPGHAASISIAQAVVRWSEKRECGVSLVALDPAPAALLSEFFSSLTAVQPMAEPTAVND